MLTVAHSAYDTVASYTINRTSAFGIEAGQLQNDYLLILEEFTRAITTQTLAQRFAILTAAWKERTKYASSSYFLMMDPAYLEIISMGKDSLPLIFADLANEPAHWFPALSIITRANPVPPEKRGDIRAMTEAWLMWAFYNGYAA